MVIFALPILIFLLYNKAGFLTTKIWNSQEKKMVKIFRQLTDPVFWFSKNQKVLKRFISFLSAILYLECPRTAGKLFREKFTPVKNQLPFLFRFLFLLEWLSPWLFFKILITGVNLFASRFIAGNGLKEVIKTIKRYEQKGFLINLDILGESVLSEKEADHYQTSYLQLIEEIGPQLPNGSLSISLKGSAFYSQSNPCAPEYAAEKIVSRLKPILQSLKKIGGHAYLDAEEYSFREIHFLVFKKLYEEFGNAIRFVLQAYLRSSVSTLGKLSLINDYKKPIWIRLVRGAYWDLECYHAELLGWEKSPVFIKKQQTDDCYHELFCEGAWSGFIVAPATHNIPSLVFAEKHSQEKKRPIPEIQVLFGIGEQFSGELIKKGVPVRVYMPILFPKGKLTEAMAYLLRRINESQISFIMNNSGEELSAALKQIVALPERRWQNERVSQ